MSCFNKFTTRVLSFKREPLIKEIIYFILKSLFSNSIFLFFKMLCQFNLRDPIYLIKAVEKGRSNQKLKDRCAQFVFSSENYFKKFYQQSARTKKVDYKKFTLLILEVFITTDEVFEQFFEVSDDHSISTVAYLKLLERLYQHFISFFICFTCVVIMLYLFPSTFMLKYLPFPCT